MIKSNCSAMRKIVRLSDCHPSRTKDMFRDASGEQVQSDRIIGEVSKGGARRMRKRCR
jgi:hypothetical protein